MRLARRETGLSPPVKYFTDRSKAVLLLWIIYVISVLFLLCFRARLFIDDKSVSSDFNPRSSIVKSVFDCRLSGLVLFLFLAVSWIGLWYVIVAFPGHNHLLFSLEVSFVLIYIMCSSGQWLADLV